MLPNKNVYNHLFIDDIQFHIQIVHKRSILIIINDILTHIIKNKHSLYYNNILLLNFNSYLLSILMYYFTKNTDTFYYLIIDIFSTLS